MRLLIILLLNPAAAKISKEVYRRCRWTTFINTTYDISLDSQISLLPLGFSLHLLAISFLKRESKGLGILIITDKRLRDQGSKRLTPRIQKVEPWTYSRSRFSMKKKMKQKMRICMWMEFLSQRRIWKRSSLWLNNFQILSLETLSLDYRLKLIKCWGNPALSCDCSKDRPGAQRLTACLFFSCSWRCVWSSLEWSVNR